MQTAGRRQETADSRQQTTAADSRHQTAESRQQATDSRHKTAYRKQKADSKQAMETRKQSNSLSVKALFSLALSLSLNFFSTCLGSESYSNPLVPVKTFSLSPSLYRSIVLYQNLLRNAKTFFL